MQTVEESSQRKEAVGENGLRERRFIVSWIKHQLSQRPEQTEKEAFLSKHRYVMAYHSIKMEEILD